MHPIGSSTCATLLLCSCGALPESSPPDDSVPNANAGPFRALAADEVGNSRVAPNVLTDTRGYARDVAVIDLDGDPGTYDVAGFFAAAVQEEDGAAPTPSSPTRAIVRYDAVDGRSFDRTARVVLTLDAPWEGNVAAAPAVVRVGSELFLYYAAAGGIGLARGAAPEMSFTKVEGPVLGPALEGWEQGRPPKSPGVARLHDGSFRMFYEVELPSGGSAVGEARSSDGVSWTRLGVAPVLAPSGAQDPGGPFPVPARSAEGRDLLRVYYGAVDRQGHKTIGLAARWGRDGPLQHAAAPVFGTGEQRGPSEPCVVVYPGFALLFVTQTTSALDQRPAVAAGVAPSNATLPPAPK